MFKDVLKQISLFVWHPEQVWPYPRIILDTFVTGLTLAVVGIITLRALGASEDAVSGENGLLESMQVAALCVATLLAALAAVRLRPAGRFVAATTAILCLAFFVREIPTCRPEIALGCVPRVAHRLVPLICVALLAIHLAILYRTGRTALMRMVHPAFSWPLAFVAALMVAGEVFEGFYFRSLEEISELVAYMGLLLSSAWMLKSSFHMRVWDGLSGWPGRLLQRFWTFSNRHR
ncbi:hypothetical protein ACQKKX_10025 [Neorhizobium sp. NPDC001467]|uniref:hypothetical protein n=1 Tax=Neorhizobium sp. NPDC001467 TaxID=3390595 RepID=UPI003CFF7FAB